jgi:outer membrane biosynthesis protein TonB
MKTLREEVIDILEGGGSYFHKATNTRYTLNGGLSTKSLAELPSEAELSGANEERLNVALANLRARIGELKEQEVHILEKMDELRSSAKEEPAPEVVEEKEEKPKEEVVEEAPEEEAPEEKPAPKKAAPKKRKTATKAKSE